MAIQSENSELPVRILIISDQNIGKISVMSCGTILQQRPLSSQVAQNEHASTYMKCEAAEAPLPASPTI